MIVQPRLRARTRRRRDRLTPWQGLLLAVAVVLTLFPVYWMVNASLKTNFELLSGSHLSLFPDLTSLQLGNYVQMWRQLEFASYLRNSLIVDSAATVVAVSLAALAGFSLAYFRFRGAGAFGIAITATQLLPGIMFLLPAYLILRQVGLATGVQLIDTYQGLILLYVAFFMPLSIWILRSYFSAIPRELVESAQVDGCSVMGAFWRVVLPLSVPGLIATATYIFLSAWDELLFAAVMMNTAATQTMPVGIRDYIGTVHHHYDLLMAAATVACVPPALVFLFLQRYMVSGLTAGAVK